MRTDRWWLYPLVTAVILTLFVIYGTVVAFANTDYFVDPYLSPFYSPCLAANCDETTWNLVGDWWRISPALLILPFPLTFRLTCYYYRKAYYRSFVWSPPACAIPRRAVALPRGVAVSVNSPRTLIGTSSTSPYLSRSSCWWDALKAFNFDGEFGMGLGTLVPAGKRGAAGLVHALVSFLPASGGGRTEDIVRIPHPTPPLASYHAPQHPPRKYRLDQPFRGGDRRPVYTPSCE